MPRQSIKRAKLEASPSDTEAPSSSAKRSSFKKQKNDSTIAAASKDEPPTWELGNKRRIVVSRFNNATFVNIREFYEKNGEFLPAKKGISLSIPQWQILVDKVGDINAALKREGVSIKGPGDGGHEDEDEDVDMDSPAQAPSRAGRKMEKSKPSKKTAATSRKKSNIEATSDEDDKQGGNGIRESDESDDD